MRIINLDMDGVVADFNLYASNLLRREIGWEGRDLSDEEWHVLASQDRPYFQLPLIEASRELVNVARELAIKNDMQVRFLTAIPRRTTMLTAEQDKRDWLSSYFPGVPMEIGPYSKDKQKWASPLDILVDDKKSNCLEWFAKGGISIYHVGDFYSTIANLERAVKATIPTIYGPLAHAG